MISPVNPRNAEASEQEASFPILSVIRRIPSSWIGKCLHALGHFFASGILSKCHGQESFHAKTSLQMRYRMYHKYQHDLYIIKTSSAVKLMIAIVSNDSSWQDCIIALYYYVLWFCFSSSTYFLTTVMLSILMILWFCLQPSDKHFLLVLYWYCSCSLLFQAFILFKTFLTCQLIYIMPSSAKTPGKEFTNFQQPVKTLSTLTMVF